MIPIAPSEYHLKPEHRGSEPIVSMDNSLSELGKEKIINFDYDRYSVMREALQQKLGITTEAPGHHIAIEPMDMTATAEYFPSDRLIRINSHRITQQRAIQKDLQHEEGHDIDFAENPPTHHEKLKDDIGRKATVAWAFTWPFGAANALLLGGEVATHGNVIETATNPYVLYSSLGVAALYAVRSLNHHNKRERIARKAQRMRLNPVITTTKRSKNSD